MIKANPENPFQIRHKRLSDWITEISLIAILHLFIAILKVGSTDSLSQFLLILLVVAMYVVPMTVLCSPIWFYGRAQVRWTWIDFSVAWFPYVIWSGLTWTNWMPKESFNFIEAVYVGSLTPICPVLRLIGKKWIEEDKMAWITVGIGVILAVLVYFMTPCYPK